MNGRKSLLAILGVLFFGALACSSAMASGDRVVIAEDFGYIT